MDNKVYYEVRENKRTPRGFGAYTTEITLQKYYHEDEIDKAIKHYKKKKSNEIIRYEVEYCEDIPYAKQRVCFGDIESAYTRYKDINSNDMYLVFRKMDIDFKIY